MARRTRRSSGGTAVPRTVEDFLKRLEAANGELRITAPSDEVRAAWRRIIHAVRQGRHVPEGWHLLHRGRDSGDLVIELRVGEHPFAKYRKPTGERVPIPDALIGPHPVVEALREQPNRLPASPVNRSRTLLICQAIAREAKHRGLAITAGVDDVILVVEALGFDYEMRFREESGARWALRLELELDGPGAASCSRWADRSGWRVEEALGQVFDEILMRATDAGAEEDEQQRRQAERDAAEHAKVVREHRARVLREQVAAWRQAEQIRQHCDQLVAAGMSADDDWVLWARAQATEIDPLTDPPGMPGPPPNRPPKPPLAPSAPASRPQPKPWHPNQKWWSR